MNKILYTGPTCQIGIGYGRWNFTKNKLYDIHDDDRKYGIIHSISFIISDDNNPYYLNTTDIEHLKPVKILDKSLPTTLTTLGDMPDYNFIFIEIDKWREQKLNNLGI